ncbi:fibrinogen-like protein 1 [Drosophila innubila]|uniref:fibrinogen-like protein 1 n=1 Tax=Drosophila innubila TaxID=198719 RepID=UPI00148CB3C5|nr:fibrinogen-like protein 1 [Drosophila innubila]
MLLKSMQNLFLFICLLLVSWKSTSAYSIETEMAVDSKDASYHISTFDTVNPILNKLNEKFRKIYDKIMPYDSDLEQQNESKTNYGKQEFLIRELKTHNFELQNANEFLKNTVEQLTKTLESTVHNLIEELITLKTEKLQNVITEHEATIEELNSQIAKLKPESDFKTLETMFEKKLAEISASNAKSLAEKDEVIDTLKSQVKINHEMETQLKEFRNELKLTEVSSSCIRFGEDPGLHEIKLPGIESFEVLCDSETVGPGWTVIQQRINGEEDFYRDWNTYSSGFGSFLGDFFLGLEKIHQLTSSQRYELYIHMENFNGSTNFARYDDFKVSGEDEDYELSSLGEFSGSEGIDDMLRWHENQKFTTFDRENDDWADGNCAEDCHGGWWYKACASSNLNGIYSDVERTGGQTVYWAHYVALKKVMMLIRPKAD